MKKSMRLAIGLIAIFSAFYTTVTFSQTAELDSMFNSYLSEAKGVQVDTNYTQIEMSFPGEIEWNQLFQQKWASIEAQIKLNLASIPKNRPDTQKRIEFERSSARSQYKSTVEEVKMILLNRADIQYNQLLNEIAQENMPQIQRERESSRLLSLFNSAKALISSKSVELTSRFSPPAVVEEKKKGVVSTIEPPVEKVN